MKTMTRSENLQKVHYNDNHPGTFGSCNYCQQNIEEPKPSHTSTPWYEVPNSGPEDSVIFGDQGDIIVTPQCSTVNAAFIVKAVNNFDLMFNALDDIVKASNLKEAQAYAAKAMLSLQESEK